VLDPFAGGSVRGVVASRLGLAYHGIDLRPEQVDANEAQGALICAAAAHPPAWTCGDSLDVLSGPMAPADMVFSCPPYADLEVYSDDERDLSNMDFDAFLDAYRRIVALACANLKEDRFACFVVGDVRDPAGLYRNFVGETVRAFLDAGLRLYNEAILVTAVGSLPIRTGKQFAAARKLGKTHQNVLVFVKGDPRRATEACGEVEVGDVEAERDLAEAA
jgi:DNA modification methylase